MRIKGLYTAIVTPFHADGTVDFEGLRHNIKFQLDNGVDGIVVLGTTGECPTLTEQEQELITKVAREEIGDKAVMMVGTGRYSTVSTIKATQRARDLGADAALIVTPYYNKPTQEGIYRHFEAVTQNVDLPILVYNHQGRTGQNIQTETLARIAKLPTIVGVKDSSMNTVQMMEIVEQVRAINPDFCVMSGDDVLILALMVHGGNGAVSTLGNLLPDRMKALVNNAACGKFEEARRQHFELLPLFRGQNIETNPIPIKSLMNICGMPAGPCRLPLCELRPDNHLKLIELVNTIPYLNNDQAQSTYSQAACRVSVP